MVVMEATVLERGAEAMGDSEVSLERIDERVEQLGKSMDQVNSRIGRFESQVNDRFGRVESGINQLHGQFQELQQTLVQMIWALVVAMVLVFGGVVSAQF